MPDNNYEVICKNIVNDQNLVNIIISLNKEINKFDKFDILRFIRWCKSVKNIFDKISTINHDSILKNNKNYIIGISALRSIIDRFDSNKRGIIVTKCLRDYLPEKLYNLLALDFEVKLEENPFEIIENNVNNNYYIVSKYSGIVLDIEERPNIDYLDNIKWTKSSVDIADAILVALVSKTILILEGPPGRGKTAISKAVFDCLNIKDENLKRINFSPSTTIEDVFSRTIPKIQGNEISTIRKEQGLLSILNLSKNSNKYYQHGLILDEINLASDELLEILYSYLISIFYDDGIKDEKYKDYISPDGYKYEKIGNIGVIATMNDAKISNSRTSLSNSFLNLCHSFKLSNYTTNEIILLADEMLYQFCDKNEITRIINCYKSSQNYCQKYSENGGNTFREILKLRQFLEKCRNIPLEYLLELILCANIPQSEIENFKNEVLLNNISDSLADLKLKIENNYLCFDNYVKYKLLNDRNNEVKTQFTISQKEAMMKMMIGLLAERPILLTGDLEREKHLLLNN